VATRVRQDPRRLVRVVLITLGIAALLWMPFGPHTVHQRPWVDLSKLWEAQAIDPDKVAAVLEMPPSTGERLSSESSTKRVTDRYEEFVDDVEIRMSSWLSASTYGVASGLRTETLLVLALSFVVLLGGGIATKFRATRLILLVAGTTFLLYAVAKPLITERELMHRRVPGLGAFWDAGAIDRDKAAAVLGMPPFTTSTTRTDSEATRTRIAIERERYDGQVLVRLRQHAAVRPWRSIRQQSGTIAIICAVTGLTCIISVVVLGRTARRDTESRQHTGVLTPSA
jgi:hypothetical protein